MTSYTPTHGGRTAFVVTAILSIALLPCSPAMSDSKGGPVFTSASDASRAGPDFAIQGEYEGRLKGGSSQKAGVHVIALGHSRFQAVVYPGGLPGAGWDGRNRSLADGRLADDGETATFVPATGNRKYIAGPPDEFSASATFPPEGHEPWALRITKDRLSGRSEAGATLAARRVVRKSPTLGAVPPEGAIVLFDGTDSCMKNFKGGRLDTDTRWLNTDRKDIKTAEPFNDYVLHLEFMLPFRPTARGQKRGNSGLYNVNAYEIQVLDSFGLEGLFNECGGIYKVAPPRINMCFPPLQWQTYDVEFTNARQEGGKVTIPATITCRHNGVLIHDVQECMKATGAAGSKGAAPCPIRLQGHGNPLQYRNIWIVPKQ